MKVEVVYALPREQHLVTVDLPPGSCAADAVAASGLPDRFADIDPQSTPMGVFGRHCGAAYLLSAGDRVEIYRPLQVDPKEARKLRARGRGGR